MRPECCFKALFGTFLQLPHDARADIHDAIVTRKRGKPFYVLVPCPGNHSEAHLWKSKAQNPSVKTTHKQYKTWVHLHFGHPMFANHPFISEKSAVSTPQKMNGWTDVKLYIFTVNFQKPPQPRCFATHCLGSTSRRSVYPPYIGFLCPRSVNHNVPHRHEKKHILQRRFLLHLDVRHVAACVTRIQGDRLRRVEPLPFVCKRYAQRDFVALGF